MTPRCIVEVRWGKLGGEKAVIEPGKTLRVGRTSRADFEIAHDSKMSNVHFELSWDGKTCTLRDLGSMAGTELHGEKIGKEATVRHGGWIHAGETDFLIYIEGNTKAPIEDGDEEPSDDETVELSVHEIELKQAAKRSAEEAHRYLQGIAKARPLYAILDAARDERILILLREAVEQHRSLYEGTEGQAYEDVAPYIVGPLSADSRLLSCLVLEGWGKRWGLYCTSGKAPTEVRRHFRRFLMAELGERSDRVYFRFYDPWVWRMFLPMCTPKQSEDLFRDIDEVYCEGTLGEPLRFNAEAPSGVPVMAGL